MKYKKILPLLVGGIILTGCGNEIEKEPVANPPKTETTIDIETTEIESEQDTETKVEETEIIEESKEEQTEISESLKQSNLETNLKLVDSLYEEQNIMLSPLSLEMALGLVTNGAEGETLKQLETYLGKSIEEYNTFSKDYFANLEDGITLSNSVWVDQQYNLKGDYAILLNDYYHGTAQKLDFKDAGSVNVINSWISKHTNEKFNDVIKEIKEDTTNIVVNTLNFDKKWEVPFESEGRKDLFHGTNRDSNANFLIDENKYIYYENDYATGFSKDYEGGRYSFVGILPKEKGEFNLSDLDITNLLNSASMKSVYFELPEFEFESDLDLLESLKGLGLIIPFTDDAEFTKMLEDRTLKIDSIIQKTKIKLDKEGTEASAVTVIGMMNTTAVMEKEETKRIILNRPFAFIIMDNETNTPLFIGKIVNFEK